MKPEEYLRLERATEFKSEYINGEIYAMAGVSREHSLIVTNLGAALHSRLRGRPCETHLTDLRVSVPDTRLYTYPDALVICGDPVFVDDIFDTVTNPIAIFEVLSPSTEGYDRGAKFAHYRRLITLRYYVLISQGEALVECYERQDSGGWLLQEFRGLDATLLLPTLELALPLADLYERISFPVLADEALSHEEYSSQDWIEKQCFPSQ
ncbi:Uma2 family endonuclease [Armatimonas sp.]|uniref:Uma2 family endonuclease n=1 Tax=Armatimonas sp. TaxID=1872638 RepID=UPI003753C68A